MSGEAHVRFCERPEVKFLRPTHPTICRGCGAGSVQADLDRARQALTAAGLSFPIVAKPDIGWRGYGVRLIENEATLEGYLAVFPEGEVVKLQRLIPYDGEAGVLYARLPGNADGQILSLTFRYFPYVIGDGTRPCRWCRSIASSSGQQRLLFEIGARNRARGYRPVGIWAVLSSQWRQHRLIRRYPPSG